MGMLIDEVIANCSLLGLALQQGELLPLPLCRHVYKFVLDRSPNWFDLAFFDAPLYESLRMLAIEAASVDELQLTMSITLGVHEGGPRQAELVANGANIAVTEANLLQYLMLYCQLRLVDLAKPALTVRCWHVALRSVSACRRFARVCAR